MSEGGFMQRSNSHNNRDRDQFQNMTTLNSKDNSQILNDPFEENYKADLLSMVALQAVTLEEFINSEQNKILLDNFTGN